METPQTLPEGEGPTRRASEWSWPLGPALAHAALEKAPAIIYIYDVKAECGVFQNRRFAELLGQPLDGGNDWRRYIHADDAAGFPEHRARLKAIRPDETLTWTYRMQAAEGDWRYFISRDVLLDADEDGAPRLVVGTATEISEQKAIEERKNLVIGEMRHRVRNLVAMIDAIGRQSMPKDQPLVKEFFDVFMGRMRALLEAAELVSLSEHRIADMRTIAAAALGPFLAGVAPRVAVDGPHVFVPENAAGGLALAFYELATNAAKYGALSRDEGSVALSWAIASTPEARTVTVEWKERGGPPVSLPIREGFGSRVIRNAMSGRGSEVDLAFRPEGLECRIVFAVPQP
jgi:two-component sensor histidine kinase